MPDDVSAELQSCGGTAFREAEISIDGQAAGVAPVYPWIYTGGIDVLLWRPYPLACKRSTSFPTASTSPRSRGC